MVFVDAPLRLGKRFILVPTAGCIVSSRTPFISEISATSPKVARLIVPNLCNNVMNGRTSAPSFSSTLGSALVFSFRVSETKDWNKCTRPCC